MKGSLPLANNSLRPNARLQVFSPKERSAPVAGEADGGQTVFNFSHRATTTVPKCVQNCLQSPLTSGIVPALLCPASSEFARCNLTSNLPARNAAKRWGNCFLPRRCTPLMTPPSSARPWKRFTSISVLVAAPSRIPSSMRHAPRNGATIACGGSWILSLPGEG